MKSGNTLLKFAADLLEPLSYRTVFLGGATVHLHIDDPAAPAVRFTKDVDVVVAVETYSDFAGVEAELRELGFEQSLADDDEPICRWHKEGLALDIMPIRPELIGFTESKWFEEGMTHAVEKTIDEDINIEVFDVLYLLAAKIDAYRDRGNNDAWGSHDFEDIVAILNGCTDIWSRLSADTDVAVFVREWLKSIDSAELTDAIAGHTNDYDRARFLGEKIGEL